MFRFADQGRVWWPVTLAQANGPDDIEEVQVWLQYRIYTREELREQERRAVERIASRKSRPDAANAADSDADAAADKSPEDLIALFEAVTEREAGDVVDLATRIEDWRGFGDGDTEWPFDREKLQALLEFAPAYKAMRVGLFGASREAPRKNSKPGPGGSPARTQA